MVDHKNSRARPENNRRGRASSASTTSISTDQQRLDDVETFLDRLFGKRKGYVYGFRGVGGHFAGGTYEFTLRVPCFFPWPQGRLSFLADVISYSAQDDLYICPQLRQRADGKKDDSTTGRHLFADVDGAWDNERESVLEKLRARGAFVVHSGRGRHVYVPLADLVGATEIERGNKILADALRADSKWAENALLRIPGTFNHKPRALGGSSALVTVEWS